MVRNVVKRQVRPARLSQPQIVVLSQRHACKHRNHKFVLVFRPRGTNRRESRQQHGGSHREANVFFGRRGWRGTGFHKINGPSNRMPARMSQASVCAVKSPRCPGKFERFVSRLPPRKRMTFYNLCRHCGRRVPASVPKCGQCGSSSNTNQNKKIMSGVFIVAAILLMLVISRIL